MYRILVPNIYIYIPNTASAMQNDGFEVSPTSNAWGLRHARGIRVSMYIPGAGILVLLRAHTIAGEHSVCVLHIKPFFLLVDIQHTQCPC